MIGIKEERVTRRKADMRNVPAVAKKVHFAGMDYYPSPDNINLPTGGILC